MTTDYYQNLIEELMPANYDFVIRVNNSQYRTEIYRNDIGVDATTHESLTYALNHVLGYFKTLQTLTK